MPAKSQVWIHLGLNVSGKNLQKGPAEGNPLTSPAILWYTKKINLAEANVNCSEKDTCWKTVQLVTLIWGAAAFILPFVQTCIQMFRWAKV